ncbi:MAG TPA: 3-keto-5-aminohexanoate cleavage protein [Arenicellales bacterium]|nr:3-keto-5-aminohexanoate cleavage protein [Arenicellales bacterium]
MDDWQPLALAAAPNGAYKTKADHPALPLTPAELAETAARCRDAGAAMLHLHVRDTDGRHSLDPELYGLAMDAVRRAVGDRLVIQVTSESGRIYEPEAQMQAIRRVRPEAVSLALRELIPDTSAEREAAEFFQWLAGIGCVPQYILYSADEVDWYRSLRERSVIPEAPHWLLFVLGRYSDAQQSQPADLLPFLREPVPVPWAMCAFGRTEHACAVTAAALGGHVRIGFENNLLLKDGTRAPHNAALVAQAAEAAALLNRPLLDADGLRDLLVS